MHANQVVNAYGIETTPRVEINFKRVSIWAIIFTDIFFVSFFFGRLLEWI